MVSIIKDGGEKIKRRPDNRRLTADEWGKRLQEYEKANGTPFSQEAVLNKMRFSPSSEGVCAEAQTGAKFVKVQDSTMAKIKETIGGVVRGLKSKKSKPEPTKKSSLVSVESSMQDHAKGLPESLQRSKLDKLLAKLPPEAKEFIEQSKDIVGQVRDALGKEVSLNGAIQSTATALVLVMALCLLYSWQDQSNAMVELEFAKMSAQKASENYVQAEKDHYTKADGQAQMLAMLNLNGGLSQNDLMHIIAENGAELDLNNLYPIVQAMEEAGGKVNRGGLLAFVRSGGVGDDLNITEVDTLVASASGAKGQEEADLFLAQVATERGEQFVANRGNAEVQVNNGATLIDGGDGSAYEVFSGDGIANIINAWEQEN